MSEVIWRVNNVPVADLGISVAGGTFRTQGVSHALLDVARNFDAAPVFTHGQYIVLSRTIAGGPTVIVFQGKVAPISKIGQPDYEGHEYPVEDAWADLERTTYQEQWAIGGGSYYIPKAVLGLDSAGNQLTIGQQISAAINYAATQGVSIQMGSVPSGEILWPEEVSNISCTEVINKCLEFHPDWLAWIDHSSTPPVFNVTKSSSAFTAVLATNGTGPLKSFTETRRDDLMPTAVRIVYEYANNVDDEVFRNAVIQKWPPGGPDGGPRVICTTIPLAGGDMQIQKSRIRVRPMPESGEKGTLTKNWLKKIYPQLKDIPVNDFKIKSFETSLYEDADQHPPEINERALRLVPTSVTQIPNQLLDGSIEDWIRKKVGQVHFSAVITAEDSASDDNKKIISAGLSPGRTTCTNAVTKLYKGITQWSDAEEVPEGIAQGVFDSMTAAYKFEGSATISEGELSGTRWHGKALTLSGAETAGAPIHSVTWDVGSGITTLGFGPVPELAPGDFLELQRRVRSRKVNWWSGTERADNKLGAEAKPSAAGDSVGGYNSPSLIIGGGGGGTTTAAITGAFCAIITQGGESFISGGVVYCGDKNFNTPPKLISLDAPSNSLIYLELGCEANRDDDGELILSGIKTSASTNPATFWKSLANSTGGDTQYPSNSNPTVTDGLGTIRIPLGNLVVASGAAKFFPVGCGNITVSQCAGTLDHSRS